MKHFLMQKSVQGTCFSVVWKIYQILAHMLAGLFWHMPTSRPTFFGLRG
jgi:hypothetical protein